jgi:hemoglobin/transferrin/lactoferrin receptor protein
MKKIIVFGLLFFTAIKAYTQSTTVLDSVVVSTSNIGEAKKYTTQKIEIITAAQINNTNAQNIGDLLTQTGKIFVQKSQQGGSSPVLRGFEANRVLLVVDGVRLNNAIYRSGHLQNAITVDQNMLERVEVVQGAASTIYGGDALGGVIHFITKGVQLSGNKKTIVTGSAFTRYGTVNGESTNHLALNIANNKWGWYQSYNFSKFGNLRMGHEDKEGLAGFGTRPYYISQVNGQDVITANKDVRLQKFTDYKQWDITQKFLFAPTANTTHSLNLQFSNSSNIPRYDRLQDTRNFGGTIGTTLRWAEWYYGPQKRNLVAYKLNKKINGFFNNLQANINYQAIEESRVQREYLRYDRKDTRLEKVKVYGATINLVSKTKNDFTNIGIDAQYNKVNSSANRLNTLTGVTSALDTRYPDGDNHTFNAGIYLQHTYTNNAKTLVVTDGIRVQTTTLTANIINNTFLNLPFTNINQKTTALTGNIGIKYFANNGVTLKVNISSAFRAPNIDDVAKIFESSAALQQLVIPNPNIKAEKTYTFDFAITQQITEKFSCTFNPYITLFRDAIVKTPIKINGADSVLYNGVQSAYFANTNANKATVKGLDVDFTYRPFKGFTLQSTLSLISGNFNVDGNTPTNIFEKQINGAYDVVSKKVTTKPLDHIPPTLGKTSISYENSKWGTEVWVLYNGQKLKDKYNPDGEDNQQYATANGTMAYTIFNARGHYQATKNIKLQLAVENIFNKNYRPFASGLSGAGANIVLAARVNW